MIHFLEAKIRLFGIETLSGQGIYRLIDTLSHNLQYKETLEKCFSII